MDAVEQLAPEWASGMLPHASLRCRADSLGALGVRFFHDEDDLDSYQAAVLRLVPITARRGRGMAEHGSAFGAPDQDARHLDQALVFMVQRYDHEPPDSLTLFLPEQETQGARNALRRILSALHLPGDRVISPRS